MFFSNFRQDQFVGSSCNIQWANIKFETFYSQTSWTGTGHSEVLVSERHKKTNCVWFDPRRQSRSCWRWNLVHNSVLVDGIFWSWRKRNAKLSIITNVTCSDIWQYMRQLAQLNCFKFNLHITCWAVIRSPWMTNGHWPWAIASWWSFKSRKLKMLLIIVSQTPIFS